MGAASGTTATGKRGVVDTADQAGDAVKHAAHQAGRSAREAPDRITRQTEGSAVAAGIIAFGAGVLAAALLPATDAEEHVGAQLGEHSDELLAPVKQTAQDVREGRPQRGREEWARGCGVSAVASAGQRSWRPVAPPQCAA